MHSWEGDPRPEPAPEYGTIRPGSDLKLDQSIDPQSGSWRVLFAVAAGILLAAFFATGNARARIFCHRVEAELLAIDSFYKTAEDIDESLRRGPAQAWLEGNTLRISALN